MGRLGGFLRRSVLGVFCDSAGGVFCDSGRVFGYGKGGFLHPWWFSATVTRVYYIGTGSQRSGASRRHLRGRLFASVTGVFCYSGLVRGFFATVGVGGFLRQCWGGFLRQWKGFWLRQGGFFASVVVFCDGNQGLLHRHRFTAERRIKKTSSWATFCVGNGFFLLQWVG